MPGGSMADTLAMSSGLPEILIERGLGNAATGVPVVGEVPAVPGAVPVPEPVEDPGLDRVPVVPDAVVVVGAVPAFFPAPCPCPGLPGVVCPAADALLPGPDVVAPPPAGDEGVGAVLPPFGPPPLPPPVDGPV